MFHIASPDPAEGFFRVTHWGDVSQDDLLACRQTLFRALDRENCGKMLVDFSRVSSLPGAEHFIMFFAMHSEAMGRLTAIALLYRLRDHSHAEFLGSVARFHGINCRTFDDPSAAAAWLADQA